MCLRLLLKMDSCGEWTVPWLRWNSPKESCITVVHQNLMQNQGAVSATQKLKGQWPSPKSIAMVALLPSKIISNCMNWNTQRKSIIEVRVCLYNWCLSRNDVSQRSPTGAEVVMATDKKIFEFFLVLSVYISHRSILF